MAGHSKWANIKHRKAAQDSKRGKLFTKLIRELTVAARLGGDDVTSNPRLRAAVQTALSQNMTRDTIDRAIKRGTGGDDDVQLEEIRYEGYGPGGVALMVDCMTDNRNRTVAEVRHAFTKAGGNLGTDGSVSYLFTKQGVISFRSDTNEDDIMEVALEAGAEDITSDEYGLEVLTTVETFSDVKDALDQAGFQAENAEITMVASTKAELDKDTAEKVLNMIDRLEDLDDVQNVYSNADISADILTQLSE
ncbi:YebC/PmpR family DNA-binding transcriptional regulator [Thiotrichales bacterium 19S9-12]|nr:YebC/PmpR family DNA-binding transcriptional regulator [Thiotrichales bacterium 19S9-11]MCF6811180.1 YebC/PmpR family DNA-binding transcriptional regulator [Thiotrichales bacterium 19S9-12]